MGLGQPANCFFLEKSSFHALPLAGFQSEVEVHVLHFVQSDYVEFHPKDCERRLRSTISGDQFQVP